MQWHKGNDAGTVSFIHSHCVTFPSCQFSVLVVLHGVVHLPAAVSPSAILSVAGIFNSFSSTTASFTNISLKSIESDDRGIVFLFYKNVCSTIR